LAFIRQRSTQVITQQYEKIETKDHQSNGIYCDDEDDATNIDE
jgi:hypothetical protein